MSPNFFDKGSTLVNWNVKVLVSICEKTLEFKAQGTDFGPRMLALFSWVLPTFLSSILACDWFLGIIALNHPRFSFKNIQIFQFDITRDFDQVIRFFRFIQRNKTIHFYRNYFLSDSECPQTEDPHRNFGSPKQIREKKKRPITTVCLGLPKFRWGPPI